MEAQDYWRLCSELTIVQAALLMADEDPAHLEDDVEQMARVMRPEGYDAAKNALVTALRSGAVSGNVLPCKALDAAAADLWRNTKEVDVPGTIDVRASAVDVESLKVWLSGRGVSSGFFFPDSTAASPEQLDCLDKDHPRYASKLAAAIAVWRAMEDPALYRKKPPKQRMINWLRENAAEFDLMNEENIPMETAIEEIAKIANWARGGGAPKQNDE